MWKSYVEKRLAHVESRRQLLNVEECQKVKERRRESRRASGRVRRDWQKAKETGREVEAPERKRKRADANARQERRERISTTRVVKRKRWWKTAIERESDDSTERARAHECRGVPEKEGKRARGHGKTGGTRAIEKNAKERGKRVRVEDGRERGESHVNAKECPREREGA